MFIGGRLIKCFDGFRRLWRHAATEYQHPLSMSDADLLLANRVLAGLGGPPAGSQVRGRFEGDGLALLLLFLLTQERTARIGLLGSAEPVLGRIKGLVHLCGHAVWPTVEGGGPREFQQVVQQLGPGGVALRPLFEYDEEGEPVAIREAGAAGAVSLGPEGGPYTLAVMLGPKAGPAPLQPAAGPGGLHPTVLILE